MNNTEVAEKVAKKLKITPEESVKYLNALIRVMGDSLTKDEAIHLDNFGSFTSCTRAARKGKDPKTKKMVNLPACKTVRFVAADKLKAKLEKSLS